MATIELVAETVIKPHRTHLKPGKDRNMKVPFLDLKAQYASIKDEIDDAISRVIDSCAFAGGPFVEKFEHEFAQFCGCEHAIGVGSGTEALWLSLLSLGVGIGDEVITVPNTFIATVEAISLCGATPIFIDINENTYNMDVNQIEKVITKNTKAIIPVHLFGQTADMDPIMEISDRYGLFVIEDACQAHGAEYRGKKAGTMGDVGCFSFYPGKNLGAYGDSGALVTNRDEINQKARSLRDHGQSRRYHHDVIGWNCRMDGIQGAVLSVKLKHLAHWNENRRKNAKLYDKLISNGNQTIKPPVSSTGKHVYHIYAIRVEQRDNLALHLQENQIQTGIHYPVPIHFQNAYRNLYADMNYPISEKCSKEFISLPMYPELPTEYVEYVAMSINRFFKSS